VRCLVIERGTDMPARTATVGDRQATGIAKLHTGGALAASGSHVAALFAEERLAVLTSLPDWIGH